MNSSSSRVLRGDELSEVTSIWWRDAGPAPPLPQEIFVSREAAVPAAAPTAHNPVAPETARDVEKIEQEAYQRGFSEGRGVGRDQAKAELQPVLDRLAKNLAELSSLRSRMRKDAEGDLLKLAMAIARRVLHRELTLDPESIQGVIKVALEKLQSRDLGRVRVHPDHEKSVRAALERYSTSPNFELSADPSLQCGDVLFETEHGVLDASIESQLLEIERGFADRLRK
jgi:flagellar assembly protein FliH